MVEAETRQDASSTAEDGFAEGRADGKRWFDHGTHGIHGNQTGWEIRPGKDHGFHGSNG